MPRLLPSSSCHSSTITACSPASDSRAPACESISDRLSGVVTSALGILRFCRARSADGVSPVRIPTLQSSPSPVTAFSNDSRVSADRARIGVIHSTVSGGAPEPPASIDSISAPSQAASVLPVPVAEWISPFSPRR